MDYQDKKLLLVDYHNSMQLFKTWVL